MFSRPPSPPRHAFRVGRFEFAPPDPSYLSGPLLWYGKHLSYPAVAWACTYLPCKVVDTTFILIPGHVCQMYGVANKTFWWIKPAPGLAPPKSFIPVDHHRFNFLFAFTSNNMTPASSRARPSPACSAASGRGVRAVVPSCHQVG